MVRVLPCRTLTLAAVLSLVLVVGAGCAFQQAPEPPAAAADPEDMEEVVAIPHAQGETLVAVNPARVVVFDFGVLDSLHHLGVAVVGLPTGAPLPPWLEQYESANYVSVGSLFEPDYEQVNSLSPDVIIVALRSAAVYPELSRIAPTIDLTVDNTRFLESFRERLQALGTLFGRTEEVSHRLDEIDATVARIKAAAADAGSALIIMTSGGEVSAFGPGSRFGLIHDDLGIQPADPDVEQATHGDAVSFEYLLNVDPDLLYVIDRDAAIGPAGETARAILDNEIVHQLKAWQNDKVFYLDPVAWYIAPGGLGSVERILAEIETSLR